MGQIVAGIFCVFILSFFLNMQASMAQVPEKDRNTSRALPTDALSHAHISGFISKSVHNEIEPLELEIESMAGNSNRSISESLLADVRRGPNEWLVNPHCRVKIRCKDGTLHADKGSIVLLLQRSGHTAIYNLHEHHSHSIYFEMDDHTRIAIPMASELFIAKSHDELTKVLAHCPVARRRIKIEHDSETHCIATSEVKPVDIIRSIHLLCESRKDARFVADKKLKDQLIKSAACVSVVSAFHGPYHRYITGQKEMVPAIHPDTLQEITTSSQHPSKGGYSSAI